MMHLLCHSPPSSTKLHGVGASPLTKNCVQSDKVRRSSELDPNHVVCKRIETTHHIACNLLTARGFKGKFMRQSVKRNHLHPPQDPETIEWLANAHTMGAKYMVNAIHHMQEHLWGATLKGIMIILVSQFSIHSL